MSKLIDTEKLWQDLSNPSCYVSDRQFCKVKDYLCTLQDPAVYNDFASCLSTKQDVAEKLTKFFQSIKEGRTHKKEYAASTIAYALLKNDNMATVIPKIYQSKTEQYSVYMKDAICTREGCGYPIAENMFCAYQAAYCIIRCVLNDKVQNSSFFHYLKQNYPEFDAYIKGINKIADSQYTDAAFTCFLYAFIKACRTGMENSHIIESISVAYLFSLYYESNIFRPETIPELCEFFFFTNSGNIMPPYSKRAATHYFDMLEMKLSEIAEHTLSRVSSLQQLNIQETEPSFLSFLESMINIENNKLRVPKMVQAFTKIEKCSQSEQKRMLYEFTGCNCMKYMSGEWEDIDVQQEMDADIDDEFDDEFKDEFDDEYSDEFGNDEDDADYDYEDDYGARSAQDFLAMTILYAQEIYQYGMENFGSFIRKIERDIRCDLDYWEGFFDFADRWISLHVLKKELKPAVQKTTDTTDQKIDELSSKYENAKQEISKLKQQECDNKALLAEISALKKELKKVSMELNDQKKDQKELISLRNYFYESENPQYNHELTEEDVREMAAFLNSNVRGIIIGGHPNFLNKIQDYLPAWKKYLPEKRVPTNSIMNADLVVFFTDHIDHASYVGAIADIRRSDCNILYLHNINMDYAIRQIYQSCRPL